MTKIDLLKAPGAGEVKKCWKKIEDRLLPIHEKEKYAETKRSYIKGLPTDLGKKESVLPRGVVVMEASGRVLFPFGGSGPGDKRRVNTEEGGEGGGCAVP